MDSEIQILRFPIVVIVLIVRLIEPEHVIEMTLASRKFKRLVQSFKLNATKFQWCLGKDSEHRIQVVFGDHNRFFHFKSPVRKLIIKRSVSREVNGKKMLVFKQEYPDAFNLHANGPDKSAPARFQYARDFTEHLLSIIRIPEYGFNVRTEIIEGIDLFNSFIFDITKTFNVFDIIYMSQIHEFSKEEVRILLEDLNIKELISQNPGALDVHHRAALRLRKIYFWDANFLEMESLKFMESEDVKISKRIKNWEINDFLKTWINNGTPANLKKLHISFPSARSPEKVMEGISTTEHIFDQDHPHSLAQQGEHRDVWGGYGKDIESEHNGKLDTFYLYTDYLVLRVWD